MSFLRLRSKDLLFALLTAGVLALCGSAEAELTAQEKANLVHLRNASRTISPALQDYILPYRLDADVKPAALALVRASREVTLEIALLLDVITEQRHTQLFDVLAAKTREERVQLAWWRGERAVAMLRDAQTLLLPAEEAATDPKKKDYMFRARTIWVEGAINHLEKVNTTLAYASPDPAAFPQIIGPHGDYENFMWKIWRSQHYAHDAMETELGTTLRMQSAKNILMDAMLLIAGVTWNQEQVTKRMFFRVVDVIEMLTDGDVNNGLPPRFQQAINGANTKAARAQIADAWKHADDAVWRLMIFLDCSKLKNPEGCGGR